ncbi:lipocalin family protein [Runella sp. SP2]|uniref:lipocalin family protein n=1 Tax=Runella sp. SP2 TaxID=2268026 RepID=UPI000F07B0AC|nr:lipocalin family protein [Runella sp. SP2]AYQ34870.1 hypothetical protein DTQ70_23045 [Runella sp. SP2]
MKKLLAQGVVTLLTLLAINHSLSAQSIVGAWKRTAIITTYSDGKTTDDMAELTKAMPCTADIVYVFEANGNLSMRVPKGCPIPAVLSTWKLNGSTLTTSMKDLTNTDQVSISGNTMTTTHVYSPQDKYVPKGTKSIKIIYKKD